MESDRQVAVTKLLEHDGARERRPRVAEAAVGFGDRTGDQSELGSLVDDALRHFAPLVRVPGSRPHLLGREGRYGLAQ